MTEFASIGDIIECKVQEPYPQLLRVRLLNEESCAYANHLIAVGRWRKVTEGELKDEGDNNLAALRESAGTGNQDG